MAILGIEEERLYYVSFDDFLQTHPELKNIERDLQERRYNHFEEKRKKILKLMIYMRNIKIILKK